MNFGKANDQIYIHNKGSRAGGCMSNLLGGSLRKESKMVKEISTTFILNVKRKGAPVKKLLIL